MKEEQPNKVFTMAVPPDLKAWLDDYSKKSGMSIATLIRFILIKEKRKAEKEEQK